MAGRPYIPLSTLPGGQFGPRLEIKPLGNWNQTAKVLGGLGRNIKFASVKAQMKICTEIQKKVRAHLRNQDLGWKALNPEYAALKAEAGMDGRTLMGWGTYYDNITVMKEAWGSIVSVGVKKGVYTRNVNGQRSKLDVASIAVIHEFASGRKFPRRPLWNPTIKEMGGAKGIQKMYINSLYYWLRMKGVPVSKIQGYI